MITGVRLPEERRDNKEDETDFVFEFVLEFVLAVVVVVVVVVVVEDCETVTDRVTGGLAQHRGQFQSPSGTTVRGGVRQNM